MRLQEISAPSAEAFRRERAWIPVLAIVALVTLAAFGAAPILALAVLVVAIVLLTPLRPTPRRRSATSRDGSWR